MLRFAIAAPAEAFFRQVIVQRWKSDSERIADRPPTSATEVSNGFDVRTAQRPTL
jgi:hypothetical protein